MAVLVVGIVEAKMQISPHQYKYKLADMEPA